MAVRKRLKRGKLASIAAALRDRNGHLYKLSHCYKDVFWAIWDFFRCGFDAPSRYQTIIHDHSSLSVSGEIISRILATLDRPAHGITALDVAAVLRPVWRSKPEVARKLYPAIRRVFDRARVILRDEHGIAMPENPARWDDLKAMGFETPKELTKGNHPSLGYGEMPDFIAALRARKATAALAVDGMCR